MVSPAEWGPSTWELLHGIAERVGFQTIKILEEDERVSLQYALKHLDELLPCPLCQGHYREWLKKRPVDTWIKKSGGLLQEAMRKWVYDLHENVNGFKSIVSPLMIEDLPAIYHSVDLREKATVLKNLFQRGLAVGAFRAEYWKLTWRHLDTVVRLLT